MASEKRYRELARDKKFDDFRTLYRSEHPGVSDTDVTSAYTAYIQINNVESNRTHSSSHSDNILQSLVQAGTESVNLTSGLKDSINLVESMLSSKSFSDVYGIFKQIAVDSTVGYLEKTNSLLETINKNVGLSGELSQDFRKSIMESWPDAERLGISFDDLKNGVSSLVSQSGKFKILDKSTMDQMIIASKFMTDGVQGFANMASKTEKYSMGVGDTARKIQDMMKSSIQLGLNYNKVIEGVINNLESLNRYGFQNGIDGLKKMSQRAIEFRMNIEDTYNLADKVWSPEGSIDLVSNLQMIGGAVGDLNDPLKLMYMSTNNIEGLQESLINATKSLVTYNNEQGRFEITGANLRRAKEMADLMGVSMDKLGTISIAAAERSSAATDLMASGIEFTGEEGEKTKEFITNLARMEGGKMVITIDSPKLQKELGDKSKIALDELTSTQVKALFEYQKELKEMTPIDVAKQQVSILSNISRNISFMAAKAQLELGKSETEIFNKLGVNNYDILAKNVENIANDGFGMIENAGEYTRNMMNSVETTIKKHIGFKPSEVEPIKTESKKNGDNIEKKESKQVIETNQNVTISVKSANALTDPLMRLIMNSDDYLSKVSDSYLFNYKP